MISNTEVTVDLSGISSPPTIAAKQGDVNSRQLTIRLVEQGKPYHSSAGTIARIGMTKPDGEQILNDAIIIDDTVRVVMTEQMLAAAGKAHLEVMLFQENTMLSSASINLQIFAASYQADLIKSMSETLSLIALLIRTETALINSENATQSAIQATEGAKLATSDCLDAIQACIDATQAALDAANGYAVVTIPGTTKQETLQTVIDMLWTGQGVLQCPVDGKMEPLQLVINHLADNMKTSALTYSELDSLRLTYTQLKNKNITYYMLAFYGRDVLS